MQSKTILPIANPKVIQPFLSKRDRLNAFFGKHNAEQKSPFNEHMFAEYVRTRIDLKTCTLHGWRAKRAENKNKQIEKKTWM